MTSDNKFIFFYDFNYINQIFFKLMKIKKYCIKPMMKLKFKILCPAGMILILRRLKILHPRKKDLQKIPVSCP